MKIKRENVKFIPSITIGNKKGIMDHLKANNNKNGTKKVEHMHDVGERVTLIESELEGLTQTFNTFSEEFLEEIGMLATKKN